MVSYDIYKNRIRKIAAVKNFIVKFRILIISVICLILAAVTALLVIKGIVVDGVTLPAQIIYGDLYEPEGGKALLSDVRFEYAYKSPRGDTKSAAKSAVAGGDGLVWSEVKPDKAGVYYIRTVTDKAFGITGYGSPVEFEIKPKTVEFLILDEAVVYGADPDEYVFDLVGGDKLIVSGLKYDFSGFEADVTNVCANADSVKIIGSEGDDVTYCYDIVTPEKRIKLVEREITVTPVGAEFVYGGAPVGYVAAVAQSTLAMLGEGDRISMETEILTSDNEVIDGAPVLAGSYKVRVKSVGIFKGDTDVTERYGIKTEESSLVIGRRPLKIKTGAASREYNGKPFVYAGFGAEGLVEGHTASPVSGEVAITQAGSILNEYIFRVTDGEADVTENYDISYEYGTLTVVPKKVTLTTASA